MITFKQFLAESSTGAHGEYVNDVAEKMMIHAIINQLFGGAKSEENYDKAYSFIESPKNEWFYEYFYDAFAEKAKVSEAHARGNAKAELSPEAARTLGEFKEKLSAAYKSWKKLSESKNYYNDIGDEDDFTPDELVRIKKAPFPGMAADNIRVKKKQDAKAEWIRKNSKSETESGGSSSIDY